MLGCMQALVKLRRVRYGKHQDDGAIVLLGEEDILGHNGRNLPPVREGLLPPVSFLVLRCEKNYATKLLPCHSRSAALAPASPAAKSKAEELCHKAVAAARWRWC